MICPFCGSRELKVIDKRDATDLSIRRRRECISCEKRFTTYEQITESELFVLKKSGVREKYSIDKLKKSIFLACKKRAITLDQIEKMVLEITQELRKSGEIEFTSDYIGSQIMDKLLDIDKVAYVRFASIFKNFESIEDFRKEILDIRRDPQ